jgi:Spy/CpxP family protein refolding chaperone
MNRWIHHFLLSSSLVGALALVPGAVAFASDAAPSEAGAHHGPRGRGAGLIGAALRLDSLGADQRAAIEKLVQDRRSASAPVRSADAQVLTLLATQVEQAHIDPQGLASSLAAEQSAANAQAAAESSALNQLHSILNATQRGQLVDGIASSHAGHGGRDAGPGGTNEGKGRWLARALDLTPDQQAEIRANLQAERGEAGGMHHTRGARGAMLQAFRGDSFDASAFVETHNAGEWSEKLAAAVVPVLTPAQRATFAGQLRHRAARESKRA